MCVFFVGRGKEEERWVVVDSTMGCGGCCCSWWEYYGMVPHERPWLLWDGKADRGGVRACRKPECLKYYGMSAPHVTWRRSLWDVAGSLNCLWDAVDKREGRGEYYGMPAQTACLAASAGTVAKQLPPPKQQSAPVSPATAPATSPAWPPLPSFNSQNQ